MPLETLDGRNQYEFAPGEEPPWRWRVPSVYPELGARLSAGRLPVGVVMLHHPETGGELQASGKRAGEAAERLAVGVGERASLLPACARPRR